MKKVVVFSDSHSGLSFMRRAIHVLKPDAFIHLGDFYDDGAAIAEENRYLLSYIVRGNCDWMSCFAEPEELIVPVFGVRLFLTHGHRSGVKQGTALLEKEARSRGADAVLYGHTHRPDCRFEDGLWILNPGTCAHYGGNVAMITINEGKILDCRVYSSTELTAQ